MLQLYLKKTPTQKFSCGILQILNNFLFTEHLRWLLLEGVCEGTSLVKILHSCHFNIFGIIHKCFRNMPIKKKKRITAIVETSIISLDEIVLMVPNRATHHIYESLLNKCYINFTDDLLKQN